MLAITTARVDTSSHPVALGVDDDDGNDARDLETLIEERAANGLISQLCALADA